MKLQPITNNFQQQELELIHPEGTIASHYALIPRAEYEYWRFCFDDFEERLPTLQDLRPSKFPFVQYHAQFGPKQQDGFLHPMIQRVGFLQEGAFKDFGISQITATRSLVGAPPKIMGTRGYKEWDTLAKASKSNYLSVLAWDEVEDSPVTTDRYLSLFANTVRDFDAIVSSSDLHVYNDNAYFTKLIVSNNFYKNDKFERWLSEVNALGQLMLPLGHPLTQLRNYADFEHPSWLSVRPLDFFLNEPTENASRYLLTRVDSPTWIEWDEAQANPLIKLELEDDSSWMWQERCTSPLGHLRLYWSPFDKYPWIIDLDSNGWVPAFVVE